MLEANAHLRTFKKCLGQVASVDQDYVVQVGLADCVAVRIALDLPVPEDYAQMTIVEALRKIAASYLATHHIDGPNPLGESAQPNATRSSGAKAGLDEYNSCGVAVGVERIGLQTQGYCDGANVEDPSGVRCINCTVYSVGGESGIPDVRFGVSATKFGSGKDMAGYLLSL